LSPLSMLHVDILLWERNSHSARKCMLHPSIHVLAPNKCTLPQFQLLLTFRTSESQCGRWLLRLRVPAELFCRKCRTKRESNRHQRHQATRTRAIMMWRVLGIYFPPIFVTCKQSPLSAEEDSSLRLKPSSGRCAEVT
jgi:hypothetical protein